MVSLARTAQSARRAFSEVRIAGARLARWSTSFQTSEDEIGVVQVLCWKSLRDAQRKELLRSRLLLVHGNRHREGDVRSLIVGKLEDLTPMLARLTTERRDFK